MYTTMMFLELIIIFLLIEKNLINFYFISSEDRPGSSTHIQTEAIKTIFNFCFSIMSVANYGF